MGAWALLLLPSAGIPWGLRAEGGGGLHGGRGVGRRSDLKISAVEQST